MTTLAVPSAGPQGFLTQAFRLRAGLATLQEIIDWAERAIAAAPESQLSDLSDLLLASSDPTANAHDSEMLLRRLGTGGSGRASIASVAGESLSRVQGGTMQAVDAFNGIWLLGSADPDLLTPTERERMNNISLEIVSWPHNVNPWAEIVGNLVPSFLNSLAQSSGGAA